MKDYAFVRPDGVIQFTSQLQDAVTPSVPAGLTLVPLDVLLPDGPHRMVDGVPVAFTIEASVDEAREQRKALLEQERERRNQLPIEYAGALFDADAVAQRNVSAWQTQLASGAVLPEGFQWRDHANNYHDADAAFVNDLGNAMTLRGTLLYQQMWALKSQIDAAATVEEVEAVAWPD